MKRNRRRLIFLGLIAAIFGYLYIGGSYGWLNMITLKSQKNHLKSELKVLETRQTLLINKLVVLEGDIDTNSETRFEIEKLAREEHGMAREDELIYHFPEENEDLTKIKN